MCSLLPISRFSIIDVLDDEYLKANPGNPSPSDYTPSMKLAVDSAPKLTFGRRIKEKPIFMSPGPCYNPKVGQIGFNRNPKVSIKGRYKTKTDSTPDQLIIHTMHHQRCHLRLI
jgi:hypothetical protein